MATRLSRWSWLPRACARDKQAEGTFDATGACDGAPATVCSWHLTLQISLTCFPYAGPIAPPAPILSPPIYIP